MTKPKILEITLLIADYMNAIAQANTSRKRCTSTVSPSREVHFLQNFDPKVAILISVICYYHLYYEGREK
ncbi:hypothetical protein CEXT_111981 [Caerostris extrusa]|uniref:Uncharacterized protein n=1 Tax=Caerostris extrusa TaxID=172846 RepID=A0AAV4MAD8_CAEEX|nr:hypothetical protein CEXT_111981 [Caerostris extrusa]